MKVLILLPPFLPVTEISKIINQILPDSEIVTDINFGSKNSEVLVATTFTLIGKEIIDRLPNLKEINEIL